MNKTNN